MWPERKFCNDTSSFFKCKLWENFGERRLGRMVQNEAALIVALKALETEKRGDDKVVLLRVVDFNLLSFAQQVEEDLRIDVMVGPHGAGLTHSAFMRDRARLVELFVDRSQANRHFHNFAAWYGRGYHQVNTPNPVNIEAVIGAVRDAIAAVNINEY